MNRDLISELITWKNARDRKPLILKGAREFSNNGEVILRASLSK
jgi:hypothetical protein